MKSSKANAYIKVKVAKRVMGGGIIANRLTALFLPSVYRMF